MKGISVFKNGVDNKNSLQLLAIRGTSYRKSVCIEDLVFAQANLRRKLCFLYWEFENIVCLLLFAEDRMKVLDVIEECQSKPREAPKENTPAFGNFNDFNPKSVHSQNYLKIVECFLHLESTINLNGNTFKRKIFKMSKFPEAKARTSLYSRINGTTGKHCSVAFD